MQRLELIRFEYHVESFIRVRYQRIAGLFGLQLLKSKYATDERYRMR